MSRIPRGRKWKNRNWLLLLLTTFLCIAAAGGLSQENAVLKEVEWTWEPGGTATFSGSFSFEGEDVSDAMLTLELKTNQPDQQGSVVFTEINGKTVKIRKRSDTLQADLPGHGAENTFQGDWYLPDEAANLSGAVLSFRAEDGQGKLIASAEMKVGGNGEEAGSAPARILNHLHLAVLILAAVTVLLWAAAILRSMLLRKKA